MKKLQKKLMHLNFKRFFQRFVIVALVAGVLGCAAIGTALHTQISETITYVQAEHQNKIHRVDTNQVWTADIEPGYKDFEHDGFEQAVSESDTGAKIVVAIVAAAAAVFAVLYWLAVAGWLYQTARRASMNGYFWLLVGLCGNLFGVLLFLLVRSFHRQKCPYCGQWQRHGHYCTHCGSRLVFVCPSCGADYIGKFCPNCGTACQLEEDESV